VNYARRHPRPYTLPRFRKPVPEGVVAAVEVAEEAVAAEPGPEPQAEVAPGPEVAAEAMGLAGARQRFRPAHSPGTGAPVPAAPTVKISKQTDPEARRLGP